jgi:hypothetical protein
MKYEFKKGKHKPTTYSMGFHTSILGKCATVVFSERCSTLPPTNQEDWNKLFGWSTTFLPAIDWKKKTIKPPHHNNSIRVAWRASKIKGIIEIALYVYNKGVRIFSKPVEVPVETPVAIVVTHLTHNILATVATAGEKGNILVIDTTLEHGWGYNLYPYFGGDEPAPVDMTLNLQV